ncbi:MAG: hypothetical protein WBB31_13450 [Saprospiraceae bacterium]
MKKVILTLLVAVLIIVTNTAYCNGNRPADGIKITITIEIGSPVTCIPWWNICKIYPGSGALTGTVELVQPGDDQVVGHGGGVGSWLISVPRESFAKYYPGYLSKLDGKNTVTFESSYQMTSDIKKALGTTRDLVIQGQVPYPLKYENGVYTITFPL